MQRDRRMIVQTVEDHYSKSLYLSLPLVVGTFIELGNVLYNEGVGIPITKYQSTERSYCIQLWATTGIKNLKTKMYKNC